MNPRDEKLLRLHDGELGDEESESLRAELSAEEREKLAALDELGGLLRGALGAEAEEAKVDLWSGLEGRLAERPPPARRRSWAPLMAIATLAAAALALVLLRPAAAPSNHAEIESLEVAGAMATVLEVPDDRGDSTTVIWMDHEESDEWESL